MNIAVNWKVILQYQVFTVLLDWKSTKNDTGEKPISWLLHVTVEPISARLEKPSLEMHGAEEKFGKISSGASKENIVQNHLNNACYTYFSI